MKSFVLPAVFVAAGASLAPIQAQDLDRPFHRVEIAQLISLQVQPERTSEEQLTNSRWTFPWEGQMRSIELKSKGELILGWNKRAKGYRWEWRGDRVVKLFVYMDHETYNLMEVAPDGSAATLHRRGRIYKIFRLR